METESPDFWECLKKEPCVFFFGSGISSALFQENRGWAAWLRKGVAYLDRPELRKELTLSLNSASSADELIDLTSQVVKESKHLNTYPSWMASFFPDGSIKNPELAASLAKLALTGYPFLTTNYDRALELAAGLSSLTYEQPERVFSMLEQRKNDSVIHLHGLFDADTQTDNIVATREQYQRLLDAKGAQFIQNLLSTRVLILIGCGQTQDDPNISFFLKFAREELHLKNPVYVLIKEGDSIAPYPAWVRLVRYGSSFTDLPPFIAKMAVVSLSEKALSFSFVANTPVHPNSQNAFALGEYHYSQERIPFIGRREEMRKIKTFLETDFPLRWWALTGQAGSGKSRLAYEVIKEIAPTYFGFFLNWAASVDDLKNFHPFADTLVVADYVKGHEKEIASWFIAFARSFHSSTYRLRFLLVERENITLSGSWYSTLVDCFAPADRALFSASEYRPGLVSYRHNFLELDDFSDEDVLLFIDAIFRQHGLPSDSYREKGIRDEYAQKFERLRFRPLYLEMFVEILLANGPKATDYRDYQEILDALLKKEELRLLESFTQDKEAVSSLLHLLVRASVSGVLSLQNLPSDYEKDWKRVSTYASQHSLVGEERKETLQSFLMASEQGLGLPSDCLEPLFPDVIKEAMFLRYYSKTDWPSFSDELWADDPQAYSAFLYRSVSDFPKSSTLIDLLRSFPTTNADALEARLSLLQERAILSGEDGIFYRELAQEEILFWKDLVPGTERIRLLRLQGLYYGVFILIAWSENEEAVALADFLVGVDGLSSSLSLKCRYLKDMMLYFTDYQTPQSAKMSERYYAKVLSLAPYADPQDVDQRNLFADLERIHLINLALRNKRKRVKDLLKRREEKVDWSSSAQVEDWFTLVCQLCESFALNQNGEEAYDLYMVLQNLIGGDIELALSDKSFYSYLRSKEIVGDFFIEAISLSGELIPGCQESAYSLIDSLLKECRENEMFSDLASVLLDGEAEMAEISPKDTSFLTIDRWLNEADDLLARYPDNPLVAESYLRFVDILYAGVFEVLAPKGVVDACYALTLRFLSSKKVLSYFMYLLKSSTECEHWSDVYLHNKPIVTALIHQNLRAFLNPYFWGSEE